MRIKEVQKAELITMVGNGRHEVSLAAKDVLRRLATSVSFKKVNLNVQLGTHLADKDVDLVICFCSTNSNMHNALSLACSEVAEMMHVKIRIDFIGRRRSSFATFGPPNNRVVQMISGRDSRNPYAGLQL